MTLCRSSISPRTAEHPYGFEPYEADESYQTCPEVLRLRLRRFHLRTGDHRHRRPRLGLLKRR